MKFRALVFTKDGNKFLLPDYWYPPEDEGDWKGKSATSIMLDGMIMRVVCRFDSGEEWIEFEADETGTADLPHVPCTLVGREFKHGAIDVILIGGPMFDEATQGECAAQNEQT